MHRFALDVLNRWKTKKNRKPLVVRGARQVGKSFLVREFGRQTFENTLEINFERDAEVASLFESNDPAKTIQFLELRFNQRITPGRTLLFLDEIQAAPSILPALRYFHELLPDLHVVAAGSLLEFALSDGGSSMPVGRIEYLHLGPMQFEEFLQGCGEERLATFLAGFHVGDDLPETLHSKLLDLFRRFLVVGGMPGAVEAFRSASLPESAEVRHSILATFKDDFGKYARRVPHVRLQTLFARIPALVGTRFKYTQVDREERAKDLARALDLLCLARVAFRVRHSSANGVPLGAGVKENRFKVLFLDVGLVNTSLGLGLLDFEKAGDALLVNAGAVCEQAVGQHLLYSLPSYQEPELYFWMREKANAAAEVDFLIAEGADIVPVEVKAGKTGRLKSLQLFAREKGRPFALRFNSDRPSLLNANTSLPDRRDVPFQLLSLPLFLVGQARRLAREALLKLREPGAKVI